MYSFQKLQEKLQSHGVKATHQRMVIYRSLIETTTHPTVDWVYESIKKEYPSISLATVYKTLEKFIENGLLRKVKSEDGKTRYDANLAKHDHIYAENTHEIIDFRDEELQRLIKKYLQSAEIENFEVKDIQIQINGSIKDADKPVHFKKTQ